MPYLRQQRKIAPTGQVTIRLSPVQRDQLIGSTRLPRGIAHQLHHAHVTQGKLQIRLTSSELDTLILSAAAVPTPDRATMTALNIFLRYLEKQSERFEEPKISE